ncbi:MAG: hypothetical protein OXF08_10680 [Bacteroidetes bacterium]|nr:hypothetical protein [Bacteroidota bacterium]
MYTLFRYRNHWVRTAIRSQDKAYWATRSRVKDTFSKIVRSALPRKHVHAETIGFYSTSTIGLISRSIFIQCLISLGFVVFLIWVDQFITIDHIPMIVDDQGVDWVMNLISVILPNAQVVSVPVNFLTAGAQIAGIILGLYFATVSIVATTAYGEVPPQLRSVLIQDKVGNRYLQFLSFTGSTCLIGLGAIALGHTLGLFSLLSFTLLFSVSIIAFVPLAKGVFWFLNPDTVTKILEKDIKKSVKSVESTTVVKKHESIQNHYHMIAAHKLVAWEEMVTVTSGRSQSSLAIEMIGCNAIQLLIWYAGVKHFIPKKSSWFERVLEHPSYLTAGGIKLDVALKTSTTLHPETVSDELWFEKRIGEIIQRVIIAVDQKKGNRLSLDQLLRLFNNWMGRLSQQLHTQEMTYGFQIARQIADTIRETPMNTHEMTNRDELYNFSIKDGLARLIPNVIAHLHKGLSGLPLDKILDEASDVVLKKSRARKQFPTQLQKTVESLYLSCSFEKDINGSIVTPSWFTHHYLAYSMSENIISIIELFLEQTEQWLIQQVNYLQEIGDIESAVMVIQRGLEAVSKLWSTTQIASTRLEDLKKWRMEKVVGQEWPNANFERWHKQLHGLQSTFIIELTQVTPRIPTTSPNNNLPDHFGFAYTTLCNSMVEALEKMDTDSFDRAYPVLVSSAFKAQQRVMTELKEYPDDHKLYYSIDVFLDMMDISGYAYVWKFGVGEDCFWDIVMDSWKVTFSNYPNPAVFIKWITVGQEYHSQRRLSSQRSQIRWQWKERMQNFLNNKGFALKDYSSHRIPKIIAVNPTVAAYFAAWSNYSPRDLFLSEYILKSHKAKGIRVPQKIEEFRNNVQRVQKNRAEGQVEGVPEFFGER